MPAVKFYANLRRLVGAKEKIISGANLRTLLENLAREYQGLQPFLLNGDMVRVRAILTLNGHTINPETTLDIPLTEQDQIAIFPPISGG
jgi:MoaD family protein